jgi:enterochelin esterase-like enzyme
MNLVENGIKTDAHTIISMYLFRDVQVDCYYPAGLTNFNNLSLLLINDGQDLLKMDFATILNNEFKNDTITPIFAVGIHCAPDRKNEYGTAKFLDYLGRGKNVAAFNNFIFKELLPFIRNKYNVQSFAEKTYAGFSLGALCAFDIVWNHPTEFTKCGAFSGSFWWRDKDQDAPDFDEATNRIMHRQVRNGSAAPWLQFFFEVGTQDETADRNNNGVIDAIDDVVSLIDELKLKGYTQKHFKYVELKDGKHDVATWAKAFPAFLQWAFGVNNEVDN